MKAEVESKNGELKALWKTNVLPNHEIEKAKQDFIARQPLGRIGKAEEIASLALYLSSDESSFVTGQTHVIDGGWSVG